MEAKRPRSTFVRNLPAAIDQVQPVRPTRVGLLGRVVEAVEHRWKLDSQFAYAGSRNKRALFFILGRCEHYIVFQVVLRLPYIAGMRFEDVYREETHLVAKLFVEFVEGGNLPPKRWSGIAAKNQYYRPFGIQSRQCDAGGLVEGLKVELRRDIARM